MKKCYRWIVIIAKVFIGKLYCINWTCLYIKLLKTQLTPAYFMPFADRTVVGCTYTKNAAIFHLCNENNCLFWCTLTKGQKNVYGNVKE